MTRARALTRGYTIVEVMMALAVMAIGTTGIISMQRVTIMANQHAKNLAIATHVAEAWQEQLASDAIGWNHPSELQPAPDLLGDTVWLNQAGNATSPWFLPVYDGTRNFGPAFDALGNVTNNAAEAAFCTHLRLRWLYPDSGAVQGNGLIRAEVRVFWLRDGQDAIDDNGLCSPASDASNIGLAYGNYHFVYKTSAVRQNTAQ
jgi:prepilin-type N-terminal cleavage/methylation domain-containing protein